MTTVHKLKVDPTKPITDVESLRRHLVQAAEVELCAIPLYLYAAYSIKTAGASQWNPGMSAFRTIRSVVIEEMLHLCLARNLLVAVGGGDMVRFYDRDFMPKYPEPMPHHAPELMLHLEPCSVELMQTVFMPFELPAKADAPPEDDQYATLGQFYAAVKAGFDYLDAQGDLWINNQPELQYDNAYWNNDGGGGPIRVVDLASAHDAIDMIVEQGEGMAPGDDEVPVSFPYDPATDPLELSHYAKFKAIAEGIGAIGDVWPVPTDPSAADYESPAKELATLFNAAYSYVLCMIDTIYNTTSETVVPGHRSERYGLERTFIAAMGGLLYPIADLLVRQEAGGFHLHAAPTFEYYELPETGKKEHLEELCRDLVRHYPELGGDDGVQRLIGKLPAV
jgi:hypothetical protein